jgi:UDPglucose--hexose-1-phosphate uridylyltransferase
MAKISYKAWQQVVEFHNPLKNGELDRQKLEVRLDPLTEHQSILSEALKGKVSILFPETDYAYLHQRIEATKEQCFMCDGKWRKASPRYPEHLIPGGQIERGEIALFPNLFPLAPYHAVVKVGEKHGRTLDDLSSSLLFDAFSVSLEFIRRCFKSDPEARFFTINANFMPPAGGSLVHPHLQIIGSSYPMTHHRLLLERSLAYHRDTISCYWLDLVETEKESGQRWLGEIGPGRWFTAFSPIGVNEVNAVWPHASNFLEWDDRDVEAMAEGVHRVLLAYHDLKFSTFNFSCFSGPLGEAAPEFRCFLRLINRQNMHPNHRTDDYYLQKLLKNEIIIYPPEELASLIKDSAAWPPPPVL